MFEFGSKEHDTPVVLIRLNYAVEMRYGVLADIATKVWEEEAIDVTMGHANVIWQGDANALILRAFDLCRSPARHLNVTGPETLSIRSVAEQFGQLLGKEPKIVREEAPSALLSNASNLFKELGRPSVSIEQVMEWTARWIRDGGRQLGKPTHFEVRDGQY
jgi:nucleoside-diphosphate-sugar epimerase